jgi:putative CocE/NonD family hydrolase
MRRRTLTLSVAAVTAVSGLLALPAVGATTKPWTPRPATYGVNIQRDVKVVMDDGITLDVDVYRPSVQDGSPAPGKFPVIVTQTPYNKNGPLNFANNYLVERGYIQVIADVRGTGGSEGQWDTFSPQEQHDGKTLVDWARVQPWSDGDMALSGTSYGAINQLLTAEQQPQGLKAIFPIVPASDTYRDVGVTGGQLDTSFIPSWIGLVTGTSMVPPTYILNDPTTAALTLVQHGTNVAGFPGRVVTSAAEGGEYAYDGPFYRTRSPITNIAKVNVPTFIVGGWFDLFQRGEQLDYNSIRANGVPVKLLMGPWTHLQAGQGLDVDGVPNTNVLQLRWFDHYVRGIADPTLNKDLANVTYYDNAIGHYQRATSWPPPGIDYSTMKLSGTSTVGGGVGALTDTSGKGADMLPYIPATGICTRSTIQWTAGAGAGDGIPCETDNSTNDKFGLTYDMPVTKPLKLAGNFAAHLFVSTTGKDGQLVTRVEDVDPSGKATQLTAGWQVLSFRSLDKAKSGITDGLITQPYHDFTKPSVLPVTPGQVMDVWVEIFGSATTIKPGHHLRLSIQAADAPHLTPPVPQLVNMAGSVITLLHDADHPSELVLPIIK